MTTGVSFLGLSVGCARCHDHKFDPIPSRDYYRLAATFGRAIRSETDLDLDPEANKKRQVLDAQLMARKQTAADSDDKVAGKFCERLKATPSSEPQGPWETLHVVSVESSAGTKFAPQEISFLATGTPPAKEVITIVAESHWAWYSAIRLEALADESLPQKGPGRAGNGNFVVCDLQVVATPRRQISSPTHHRLQPRSVRGPLVA